MFEIIRNIWNFICSIGFSFSFFASPEKVREIRTEKRLTPTAENHNNIVNQIAEQLQLNNNEKVALSLLINEARERQEIVKVKGQKRGEDYDPKTNIRSMEINWDDQGNMLIIRSDKKSKPTIGLDKKRVDKTYLQYTKTFEVKDVSTKYIHLRERNAGLGLGGIAKNLGIVESKKRRKIKVRSAHVVNLGEERWQPSDKEKIKEKEHILDLKAQIFAIMDRGFHQFDIYPKHNIVYDNTFNKFSVIDFDQKGSQWPCV